MADASGNGNTGAIANATWTASGKFGSALVFNGSNALVTINDAPELNLTTAMTLMAWVKPSSASTLFTDVIWKDYFAYFLEATSDSGAPGVGAFINGAVHVWVPAPSALTVDSWAHLAATYDGANVRLYVNGVQVGISAQTGTIGTTTTPLWIGGSQYFSGVIDEVRIYNVALTQAQIQGDMNTPVGGATPGAGAIQFSAATYSVGENAGTATVTVTRTGGSSGAVSVTFATSNGTATAPGDYTAVVSQTVSFAAGDTASKTVNIPIIDDTTVEANETVNLALTSPTGGATLGSPSTAVLTITDNDVASPGTLQFSAATYSVAENAGPATVTVTRTGGSSGAVSVTFATSNGTATAPGDYTAVVSQTVSFANGDTASKTVNIPIIDDTTVEGNETVNLALTAPTGGATLGSPSTAVLTITDNDVAPPGALRFSAATYSVGENAGPATVTVTRTGELWSSKRHFRYQQRHCNGTWGLHRGC